VAILIAEGVQGRRHPTPCWRALKKEGAMAKIDCPIGRAVKALKAKMLEPDGRPWKGLPVDSF